ncbi:MAG: AMP-binding protein [Alphaproteobacteria bacterium]|nr:AMP-binding protein [Alphaproteobacteria bacterium]
MTLAAWLERHAAATPGKTAIRFEGRMIDYAEIERRVRAIAALLAADRGINPGDRVAYLGLNRPEMILLLFACARLGAMLLPLNWRLAPPEHAYILKNAEPKLIFAEEEFRAGLAAILPALPSIKGKHFGADESQWFGAMALADATRRPDVPVAGTADSPVLLVYTSGTTGRPKGAVLTQDALEWNALNAADMHALTTDDRVLTVLPMFHVGGLNIQTMPALRAGAEVVLHRRFDPAATLDAIRSIGPTLCVLVPATMQALIDHPSWAAADLSSLRCVTTGSSIVPAPLIHAFHQRGVPVIQVYGSTETAPIAVYQRVEHAGRVGSTGLPAKYCQACVVDDQGREVAPGVRGEIEVRGPNVMREYWRDPAATAEAFRGAWFRTGDIAHRDADGFFWVDERRKDLIISGGENIYPAELEAVLLEDSSIAECVVVARPHPRWGEEPVAVVVPRAGAACDKAAILARFEGRLARFKHPRDVVVVDRLPRNAMGKVLRYELRAWVRK